MMGIWKKFTLFIAFCIAVASFEAWVLTRPSALRIKILRLHINLIISVFMLLCIVYIWRRLNVLIRTNHLLHFGTLFKLVMLVVLVMAVLSAGLFIMFVRTEPFLLSVMSSFCFGAVLFMTISMITIDIVSFIFRRIVCIGNTRDSSLAKIEIKIRILLSLVGALILIVTGSYTVRNLTIERISVPMKGLISLYNGTTIVQVSDIHLGPFNGKSKLESIVEKVNSLHGDIVVITGDLVDGSTDVLGRAVQPLSNLHTKYGAFYVTGNHEYYTGDVDNWLSLIPTYNVTTLVNERVCLLSKRRSCEGGFYLAGLEDLESRRLRYGAHSMNIHSALSGRTQGIPTVVLAHQPRAAAEAIMWNDVRLVLSGHTHAGQILPVMPFVYLFNPFFVGLYKPHDHVYVYVNPGTVYYFLPFRHYRPEITVITLVSV